MQLKKQQLELDKEQQTGYKSEGVRQDCILSPCLFNLYAEYVMQNAGLDEAQAGLDCWENYQSPQICKYHHPYDRKQRRPRESLDESGRGE